MCGNALANMLIMRAEEKRASKNKGVFMPVDFGGFRPGQHSFIAGSTNVHPMLHFEPPRQEVWSNPNADRYLDETIRTTYDALRRQAELSNTIVVTAQQLRRPDARPQVNLSNLGREWNQISLDYVNRISADRIGRNPEIKTMPSKDKKGVDLRPPKEEELAIKKVKSAIEQLEVSD